MIIRKKSAVILFTAFIAIFLCRCKEKDFSGIKSNGLNPVIEPDYSGVTVPENIAPMNFLIHEKAKSFIVRVIAADGSVENIRSDDSTIAFPERSWKKMLSKSKGGKIEFRIVAVGKDSKPTAYEPFYINVSDTKIDPYLCYRLLYPGYESWSEMQIIQRSTESFNEKSVLENQLLNDNCINCHSFRNNSPDEFLIHVRGDAGGTYFAENGEVSRHNLKTENMTANAVYPSWHPSGNYVAFSSNKTVQSFHMASEKNIEVTDLYSSIFIYDTGKNGMYSLPDDDTIKYMETFPCWSPKGDYLYYCRSRQVKEGFDYTKIKYDIVRRPFDTSKDIFGKAEMVFDAGSLNKSASMPSISPDGKYLVVTVHDYGTFPIWHKEADLYVTDLKELKTQKLKINSNQAESWHGWSSNGKWLVFSSKRGDGLTARPYFAYFESPEVTGKPFVLPQKDPSFYKRLEKTFNRPELVSGKIPFGPRDFRNASLKPTLKAKWIGG